MKAGKGGKAGGSGATATVTHYRASVRRGSILNFCDPLPPPVSQLKWEKWVFLQGVGP